MSNWKVLDEPVFIDRDPAAITGEMVDQFEAMSGRTLYPAQPERLIVDMGAYRETLTRIGVQEAAKLNLVRYSRGPILDYLGELLGVSRLDASAAQCTIRFTLDAAQATDIVVPADARVQTSDGKIVFAATSAATIPAGALTADAIAAAETAGAAGNGYLPGSVVTLLSTVDHMATAANITTSYGGQDAETDERLRQRIVLAPEGFAAAGPSGAYRYWTMTAHQSIVDAAVLTPCPGLVAVYPLTESGTLTSEIAALVLAEVTADKRRPITDQVVVRQPDPVQYSITAALTLYSWADAATVRTAVDAAMTSYAAAMRASLGLPIVPSKIISILQGVSGVQAVVLTAPAGRSLRPNEYAVCLSTDVTISGVVDG